METTTDTRKLQVEWEIVIGDKQESSLSNTTLVANHSLITDTTIEPFSIATATSSSKEKKRSYRDMVDEALDGIWDISRYDGLRT